MKNLAKAVIQVMAEVKRMEKTSNVGAGRNSYKGTKDQDVKEVFNNALEKAGLCMIPISIEDTVQVDRFETEYNGQKQTKQSVFTTVKTKYLLLHTSGESIEVAGYGHGVDPQDKGAGKATTYALKNALLYTFLTPVGKMPDTDETHSDEIPTPTVVKVQNKKRQTVDDDQIDLLVTWATEKKYTIEDVEKHYQLKPQQKAIMLRELDKHFKQLIKQ